MCHHIEPIDYDELGEALSRWNLGGRALTQRRPAPPDAYPGSKVAVVVPAYDKALQAAGCFCWQASPRKVASLS